MRMLLVGGGSRILTPAATIMSALKVLYEENQEGQLERTATRDKQVWVAEHGQLGEEILEH